MSHKPNGSIGYPKTLSFAPWCLWNYVKLVVALWGFPCNDLFHHWGHVHQDVQRLHRVLERYLEEAKVSRWGDQKTKWVVVIRKEDQETFERPSWNDSKWDVSLAKDLDHPCRVSGSTYMRRVREKGCYCDMGKWVVSLNNEWQQMFVRWIATVWGLKVIPRWLKVISFLDRAPSAVCWGQFSSIRCLQENFKEKSSTRMMPLVRDFGWLQREDLMTASSNKNFFGL